MEFTLQAYTEGVWRDAFTIILEEPQRGRSGGLCIRALSRYAADYFDMSGAYSYTSNVVVNPMDIHRYANWPAVFDDLMPTGYARSMWLQMLGLQHKSAEQQDIELLQKGGIAPVGNLRLKESVETAIQQQNAALETMRFPKEVVLERDHDFLNYARQRGALSGGATGAGGAAPKMLVRLSPNDDVWVDTLQNDNLEDAHYLVKFPRNNESIDRDILRAEFHFYQELAALGFNTINTADMALHEGARNPSLWLPRFDRAYRDAVVHRYGVESVFSLLNKPAGSFLKHEDVIGVLAEVVNDCDSQQLVTEYLQRDLLNIAFGNTDNHGRNTAVLKQGEQVSLAPVFDFAPMKADPEQIIRTTTWSNQIEQGGHIEWFRLCEELEMYGDPDCFKQALIGLGMSLTELPERLRGRGVPEQILDMPAMGFASLAKRLQQWGLANHD